MASRVENVFNRRINRTTVSATVPVPRDAEQVQIVIDRTLFEGLTRLDQSICWARLYDNGTDEYLGGCEWVGGTKPLNGTRPGTRLLWSTAFWLL